MAEITTADNSYNILYSSKSSPPIRELPQDFSTDTKSVAKRMDDTQKQFLNMFLMQLKHQTPDDPQKTDKITSTLAQLTMVQQAIETNRKLGEVVENLGDSKFNKAKEYFGQEISYNDSVKDYFGSPVNFDLDVIYDKELFENAEEFSLNTTITILNEEGKAVRKTNKADKLKSNFTYTWDGKDDTGKQLGIGKYTIKAVAQIVNSDGKVIQLPEVGVIKTGIVSEVVKHYDKVKLIVDGKPVSPDDIIKVKPNKELAKQSVGNLINYLDKKVEIDNSFTEINHSFGEAAFENNTKNFGDAEIRIFDQKNHPVGLALLPASQIKEGKNKLRFQAFKTTDKNLIIENAANDKSTLEYLPNGKYKYEIYIEDRVAQDYLKKLDTCIRGTIEAIEPLDDGALITVEGNVYDLKQVRKFGESLIDSTNLVRESGKYIGKLVTYNNSKFAFNPSQEAKIPFILDKLSNPNAYFAGGEVRIYDEEKFLVDTVPLDSKNIFYRGEIAPPAYEELNETSKALVKDFIEKNDNLQDLDKIKEFISENYYQRKLNTIKFGSLTPDEQELDLNRRAGINIVSWNGTKDAKGLHPAGIYSYEVYFDIKDRVSNMSFKSKMNINNVQAKVLETKIDNDKMKLLLENGAEIYKSEIIALSS